MAKLLQIVIVGRWKIGGRGQFAANVTITVISINGFLTGLTGSSKVETLL